MTGVPPPVAFSSVGISSPLVDTPGTPVQWLRVVAFSALWAVFFAGATGRFGAAYKTPPYSADQPWGRLPWNNATLVFAALGFGVATEFRAKVLHPPLLLVELAALFGGAIAAGVSARRLAK